MRLPRFAFIVAALLVLLLAGCVAVPSPIPPTPPVNIDLGEIRRVEKEVDQEVVPQNNCGGTAEVTNAITRERVISRELTTVSKFEVSASGDIKVLGTGVGLGAAVAEEVGVAYGTSESVSRSVNVSAAPGTKMQHRIAHKEILMVGTATITVGDGLEVEVPFEFRKGFDLELVGSKRLPCPEDQNATATSTLQVEPGTEASAPPSPTATTASAPTPEPPAATATTIPTAPPPIPSPTQPAPTPAAVPMVEVLVRVLNLRSGPGIGYAILGNAALGQRLPVLGQWGGCAWYQVRLADGSVAWTSGGTIYSRLNVPCSQLPAVAAPAPATLRPTTPRPPTTPVPTRKPPTASATTISISAPVLVAPEDGAEHRYTHLTFSWRWNGELQPGWAFDIRAWQNNGPHNSIVDARSTAGLRPNGSGIYSLEITIPPQYSQTTWNWTVAVVQLDPFVPLSAEAPAFSIRVDTSTPTPRPTSTPTPIPNDNGDGNGGGDPATEEPPSTP